MTNPRKPSVVLRFCEYEMQDLKELLEWYGILPRSSLVTIAIEQFVFSARESDLQLCKKRKVKVVVDRHLLEKLTKYAKTYGVHRTDIVRLAIRNFKLKYDSKNPNQT